MSDVRSAKELEKIIVRLPDGMRDRLSEVARENKRSVNAEVVARLENSLSSSRTGADVVATLYVLLDADGLPTSWNEVYEHVRALTTAGNLAIGAMEVHVITPRMVSNNEREREADALAKRYRKLLKKAASDYKA